MTGTEIARLFAYDAWANAETVASLARMPSPPARASAIMGHVVGAEWTWWARLRGVPPREAVWPTLSLEQLASEARELGALWSAYAAPLGTADLAAPIEYSNSRGERWSSAVSDVLLHVLIHAAYHRGQVASMVRGAGAEPASTDFIHAVRQGKVS